MEFKSSWNFKRVAVPAGIVFLLVAPLAALDSLSLTQALNRSHSHPALAAGSLEVKAQTALSSQAGKFENPRLSIEAESYETTARLEQTIELGGKRTLRVKQAEAERRLVENSLEAKQREVEKTVRDAFLDVLWLQEKSALKKRKVGVLEEATRVTQRRLNAGRGSAAEQAKMGVELLMAKLDSEQSTEETEAAKRHLALLLGQATPDFSGVTGEFQTLETLSALDAVYQGVLQHPQLTRWKTEKEMRSLSLQSTRAGNIPNVEFNAGIRHLRDPGNGGGQDIGWVGGVSVPLPLWNRQQGAIKGADYRSASAEKEELATRQELEIRASALWSTLRTRATQIERLREALIPGAEKAYQAAQTAYAAGQQGSLELLDGQRLLFEMNERYIDALALYHRDFAELTALAGPTHTVDGKEIP